MISAFLETFKVKKDGIFLFGIFFVSEIFTFLYYASEEINDIIGGSIKNNSRFIEAVFFKLGIRNQYITKET